MDLHDEELLQVKELSIAITKLLPKNPRNIGVPLVALEIVKENYLDFIRQNIHPKEMEKFELLQRQMECDVQRFIEASSNDMSDLK
jgi:hypothetical protein